MRLTVNAPLDFGEVGFLVPSSDLTKKALA